MLREALCLHLVLLISSCVFWRGDETGPQYEVVPARDRLGYQAEGSSGAVATAHPLASQAALSVLKDGGTAADAAITASFVISVVRPQSTGIGGGGFLMSFNAKKKNYQAYDFRERAPAKATRDMYVTKGGKERNSYFQGKTIKNASVNGHLAVGTPGLIKGLARFYQEHGTLPWKRLVKPAIDIAGKGFPVYKGLAEALQRRAAMLRNFPSSRKIFFKNGQPLKMGDVLVQKDLAKTLTAIADHKADGFYRGWVANKIIAEIKRGRGILQHSDLRTYQVKMRKPVVGTYKGYQLVSFPPPSSGGVHIIQMFNILEKIKLDDGGYRSKENIHLVAAAMKRAFADRAKYLGDPDFVSVPVQTLVSKNYADKVRATIAKDSLIASKDIQNPNIVPNESPSTTHFSVVDRWGNAVSSTQTINYTFGSCVVAEGTGVVLNDEMDDFSKRPGVPNAYGLIGNEANAIAAKKTMLSSMSPSFVLDSERNMFMVVGSPGGPRIINATFQTMLNVIEFKMPLLSAVHAARIHHQWMPDKLFIEEPYFAKEKLEYLRDLGYELHPIKAVGDVQAIIRTHDGWQAVSDIRSDGRPMAY